MPIRDQHHAEREEHAEQRGDPQRRFFERAELVAIDFQLLAAAVELIDPLFDLNPLAQQRDLGARFLNRLVQVGQLLRAADLLVLRDGRVERPLGLVGLLLRLVELFVLFLA